MELTFLWAGDNKQTVNHVQGAIFAMTKEKS